MTFVATAPSIEVPTLSLGFFAQGFFPFVIQFFGHHPQTLSHQLLRIGVNDESSRRWVAHAPAHASRTEYCRAVATPNF
jgi:hypothetical protein